MAFYFDTSALLKLVYREAETAGLLRWLNDADRDPITSDLTRTELVRAARRKDDGAVGRARALLNDLTVMALPASSFDGAGILTPPDLRSLDAIHLQAAMALGDRLDGVVTYDQRLAEAARSHGVAVISPT